MNFTIDRFVLLEKLNIISHGLPSKTPMKILEGIKIECTDSDLFLTTNNSEIAIEVLINDSSLSIVEGGKVVVPGKVFIDLIKAFDSDKVTIFLIEDKALMVKADRKEYIINIMDHNDYPDVEFVSLHNPFELNAQTLKRSILETTFACSQNNKNPMLLGVNFNYSPANNLLTLTSTNSYRLSQKLISVDSHNNAEEFNITIPAKSLEELSKCLDEVSNDEKLNIYFEDNKMLFKFKNTLFQTRLLDGTYPNTRNIILNEFPIVVTFDKDELITAVNRISLLSPFDKDRERELTFNAIQLKIDRDSEVELSSANNQGAGKEILIPTSIVIDKPFVIGFSSKYLLDALKILPSNEVTLSFVNTLRQFAIKGVSDNSLTEIILPFRLD